MPEQKLSPAVTRVLWVVVGVTMACVVYIMAHGLGLIEGMPWGPGAYYYTDIPGWEKIFLDKDITCNTTHPVLFAVLFVAWGAGMWKLLTWLDKKL